MDVCVMRKLYLEMCCMLPRCHGFTVSEKIVTIGSVANMVAQVLACFVGVGGDAVTSDLNIASNVQ